MSLFLMWFTLSMPSLAGDAPEISRSAGEEGGVVVLWPRVIPRSESQVSRAAAWVVQQELKRVAAEVLPGRPIDVRPEPERVCGQAGCKGLVLGAVLVHRGDACVAVATVSGPGLSAQTLVPWAGRVDLKQPTVPFREPPESSVTIRDFAGCSTLQVSLTEGGDLVEQALAALAGVKPAVVVPPPVAPAPTQPEKRYIPEQGAEKDVGW